MKYYLNLLSSRAQLRAVLLVLHFLFVVLALGCASRPTTMPTFTAPPPVDPAPVATPLVFPGVAKEPIHDRSAVSAQNAIAEANRVWATHTTERTAYLRAARLLNSALEEGEFNTAEEEVRLATMALQNGLLANDVAALRIALRHFENGFRGIRFAPNAGEVETFLLACRRVGAVLPDDLVAIAHPDIQAVLDTEK